MTVTAPSRACDNRRASLPLAHFAHQQKFDGWRAKQIKVRSFFLCLVILISQSKQRRQFACEPPLPPIGDTTAEAGAIIAPTVYSQNPQSQQCIYPRNELAEKCGFRRHIRTARSIRAVFPTHHSHSRPCAAKRGS